MIKTKIINNKSLWEKFVLSYKDSNFLQSWNWGEFNKSLGHKILRYGFYEAGKIKGTSLLIIKKSKRGKYIESPAGPLIDFKKIVFLKKFIKLLKEIAKKEECLFARVRPQIIDNQKTRILFKKHGFYLSPMHLHAETTWQINLSKSEKEILANMRKTTRYLIKKADKLGVIIKITQNQKDIDVLYRLQLEAVKRHKFVPFSKKYFKKEFNAFCNDNQIKIYKAIWKNKVLAIALIVFYSGEAVYHYSASSSLYSNIPASYALQWQVIKDAKSLGFKNYNLWGISPTSNPRHRFAGLTLFKKGFGGFSISWLKAHDLPFNFLYWPVFIFESVRKFIRKL